MGVRVCGRTRVNAEADITVQEEHVYEEDLEDMEETNCSVLCKLKVKF